MRHAVFVNSIEKNGLGRVIVEASNGKPEGPPFVRFEIPPEAEKDCHIGKRYYITIEETQ